MRLWSLILIVLLSIAVPTYGFGAMAAMDACPAHAGVDMDMADASSPCCDDAGASGRLPDDACATHCSLSGGCGAILFVQASSASIRVLTAAVPLQSGNSPNLPAPDSFGVWRPPRFL